MKRNIGAELAARMTLVNEMPSSGESVGAISRADVDRPQPVAWAVFCDGRRKALCETRKEAETRVEFWLDVNQIRKADDAKIVPLLGLTEAEIDAMEYVVVEGRIACMTDYGILRSLLVRLRPEFETTKDQSDV